MTHHPYEGDLRQIADRMLNCDTSRVGLDEPLIEVTGMDSLTGLELMAAVETRFGVYFSDDHIAQPRTLANILAALDEVAAKERRQS
jgi:acyl carrier protein